MRTIFFSPFFFYLPSSCFLRWPMIFFLFSYSLTSVNSITCFHFIWCVPRSPFLLLISLPTLICFESSIYCVFDVYDFILLPDISPFKPSVFLLVSSSVSLSGLICFSLHIIFHNINHFKLLSHLTFECSSSSLLLSALSVSTSAVNSLQPAHCFHMSIPSVVGYHLFYPYPSLLLPFLALFIFVLLICY